MLKKNSKKSLKIIKSIIVSIALLSSFFATTGATYAITFNENLQTINEEAKLPDFSQNGHSQASYEAGASNITSAILYVVDLIKYLLGSIAILMIIISGIRLITSVKNVEEVANKQKENLKYAIIGLVVVIIADALVKQVFFGEYGEFWRTQSDAQLAAEAGTDQVRGIYNFIELGMAALAIFMIITAGFRLVVLGNKEDETGKAKKQITWAVIGLILTALAEFVVKGVVFPEHGSQLPNTVLAQMLIINLTNFISGFIATLAIAMYMYAGYLYVIDTGKDENVGKAKKVISGATIGLFLAMAAFGIVHTVIKLEPLADIPAQESEAMDSQQSRIPTA